jgi:hypothetical protein
MPNRQNTKFTMADLYEDYTASSDEESDVTCRVTKSLQWKAGNLFKIVLVEVSKGIQHQVGPTRV